MAYNHIQIKDLPYCKPIGKWLKDRYGEVQAEEIWQKTVSQYNAYLPELPDYVLPLCCNSDFFLIEKLNGTLIRCGTCGNSNMCDYCVVGNRNPLANEYEIVTDDFKI